MTKTFLFCAFLCTLSTISYNALSAETESVGTTSTALLYRTSPASIPSSERGTTPESGARLTPISRDREITAPASESRPPRVRNPHRLAPWSEPRPVIRPRARRTAAQILSSLAQGTHPKVIRRLGLKQEAPLPVSGKKRSRGRLVQTDLFGNIVPEAPKTKVSRKFAMHKRKAANAFALAISGEPEKLRMALRLYEEIAFVDEQSTYNYGCLLYSGKAGRKDFETAFNCFKFAVNKGHKRACVNLTRMYFHGHFVEQDYSMARHYSIPGARSNDSASLYYYGYLRYLGLGTRDPAKLSVEYRKAGLDHIQESARQGNRSAQNFLRNLAGSGRE